MPSVSLTVATYAYGGQYESPQWETMMPSFHLGNSGNLAFVRFTGATDLMNLIPGVNATITAATLTISGVGSPTTPETLSARLVITNGIYPDPDLPADLNEAYGHGLSNPGEASAQNQSSVALTLLEPLTTNLGSLISDGDAILFKIENSTYSGTGLGGMTATLDVSWDIYQPSTPEVTADDIDVTVDVEAAAASVLTVVTAADINVTVDIEAASAIVPPLVTAADINVTSDLETASIVREVTADNIDVTVDVEAADAIVPPLVTADDIDVTVDIEAASAIVPPVVTAADINVTATIATALVVPPWKILAASVGTVVTVGNQ